MRFKIVSMSMLTNNPYQSRTCILLTNFWHYNHLAAKQSTQNLNLFFKRHNSRLNLSKYVMSNLFLCLRCQPSQLFSKTL